MNDVEKLIFYDTVKVYIDNVVKVPKLIISSADCTQNAILHVPRRTKEDQRAVTGKSTRRLKIIKRVRSPQEIIKMEQSSKLTLRIVVYRSFRLSKLRQAQ